MSTTAATSKRRKKSLPTLISQYYAALKDLAHQNVMYEMGVRPAFHALLAAAGKDYCWTLIAEHEKKVNGRTRLVVNKSLALAGIPPDAFEYRLGNRSALEWVIDQYQVSTDKRSGITSDPNRADDEQYIVRLVGQVVRVSVETVKIVKGLPAAFA